MPLIRQLPQAVINKIAAGEVIERPASVVKELVENSVDAGATRIEVTLQGGGLELIRVADNGCGMSADQLSLAVASHATSKIETAEDLFQVASLGFRGEALASITEISHFIVRSRTADCDAGAQLLVNGGQRTAVEPCSSDVGTTIEVRDLFFNTPVRRKFLRAAATEVGYCNEAFTRISMAFPEIRFVMRNNERVLYDLPPCENWKERIAALLGRELGAALIPIEGEEGGVRLSGYVAEPNFSRGNNRWQYLFLNGRYIRDRSLQHALTEAYRGLLMSGRFPVTFLQLEMPVDLVDVNVHPTKMEVRFQDAGRIYSQILGTLRRKFLASDLTARVRSPATLANSAQAGSPENLGSPPAVGNAGVQVGSGSRVPLGSVNPIMPAAAEADPRSQHRQNLLNWARGVAPTVPVTSCSELPNTDAALDSAANANAGARAGAGESRINAAVTGRNAADSAIAGTQSSVGSSNVQSAMAPWERDDARMLVRNSDSDLTPHAAGAITRRDGEHLSPPIPLGRTRPGVQFHNRYLVTEDEEGILIIDQHALHERVLYEQLRAKIDAKRLETQRMLVPEPVQLSGSELAMVLESRAELGEVGIGVEPFGGDCVVITSYPAMLKRVRPAELLRQLVDFWMDGKRGVEKRDLLDDMLNMVACKAAVKAGDPLAPDEIEELLSQRHLFRDTHHCPHGRPTALSFSKAELDRRFKRV